MPAVSKKQQRFFGMVRAAQKGEGAASPEVAKVAGEISKKDAKDFAKTKHKGLPEKKNVEEELTGDLKTDAERYRVPRGPGGNPKRIGDKVRSMSEKQPLGKLKIKYGAKKVRDYYKKNKAVDEGVSYGYKGKRYVKLPDKVKSKTRWDGDARSDEGKLKDAITDKLGLTNTKKHGVLSNEGLDNLKEKNYSECPKKDKAPDFDAKKELKNKYPKAIEETQTRYYKDDQKGKTKQSFSDFYKKAKLAKHKKQTDKTYIDTKRHGIKFSDAKGSGRIRGGKKYYD